MRAGGGGEGEGRGGGRGGGAYTAEGGVLVELRVLSLDILKNITTSRYNVKYLCSVEGLLKLLLDCMRVNHEQTNFSAVCVIANITRRHDQDSLVQLCVSSSIDLLDTVLHMVRYGGRGAVKACEALLGLLNRSPIRKLVSRDIARSPLVTALVDAMRRGTEPSCQALACRCIVSLLTLHSNKITLCSGTPGLGVVQSLIEIVASSSVDQKDAREIAVLALARMCEVKENLVHLRYNQTSDQTGGLLVDNVRWVLNALEMEGKRAGGEAASCSYLIDILDSQSATP
jgi:hypothetical protein